MNNFIVKYAIYEHENIHKYTRQGTIPEERVSELRGPEIYNHYYIVVMELQNQM